MLPQARMMLFERADPNRMSFLQHLEELRARLLRCVAVLALLFFAAWPVSGYIYQFLVVPVKQALPAGVSLAYTGISDPFLLFTKVSIFCALLVGVPYLLVEFWLFVAPGLHAKEKKYVLPFVSSASLCFFAGALFGYYVIVPFACKYFIGLGSEAGFQPVITIKEVFSFVMQMILVAGAVFEMPVLIYFLTRIGIVTPAFLWHWFGYAFFIIWVIAAIVTPPDVFSMILVGVPMTALYLLGIAVSWLFRPRTGSA